MKMNWNNTALWLALVALLAVGLFARTSTSQVAATLPSKVEAWSHSSEWCPTTPVTLYTVPTGRHLVITSFSFWQRPNGSVNFWDRPSVRLRTGAGTPIIDAHTIREGSLEGLAQTNNFMAPVQTQIVARPLTFDNGFGPRVDGGQTVVIEWDGEAFPNPGCGSAVKFTMTGYLAQ